MAVSQYQPMKRTRKTELLVKKMQQSNLRVFNNLFNQHYMVLYYLAARLIEDDDVVCNVVDSVFEALMKKIDSFREQRDAEDYLYKQTLLACNRQTNLMEKNKYDLQQPDEWDNEHLIMAKVLNIIYLEAEKLPEPKKREYINKIFVAD